ncbi:3-phosphoinositide-dependent protein kinase 1-related [Anaeramoeba flamelloides]|uniref:3-phosphoinositide-dependent protein kinase 1-related n=1 Tax=Anaeramoeba flamelloides TaxID=1746091 RepID=A0AAV7Y7P9_9EUKA|nr:3-phosphoinositide-dependent protein kinase 1-related [Anaeramoeba flamelloides]
MSTVSRSDFEVGKSLGRGRFGEVRMATEKETGNEYAIKILKKEQVTTLKQEVHVKNEKDLLNELDHPNIPKLIHSFQDNEHLYIVMELCSEGELNDSIRKFGSIDYEPTRFIVAQLITLLEYFYSKSIVHRDIKPENILLTKDGYIKLCDFGTAKIIDDQETKKVSSKTFQTSEGYVSPETLKETIAMPETDLWSLGCLIYHMFYGKTPFRSSNEFKVFQKVLKREFRFPKSFPEQAQDLVDKLLVINPEERIGAKGDFESLKSHPFFDGIDFNNLLTTPPPEIKAYPPAIDSSKKKKRKKERKNKKKYGGNTREEEKKKRQEQLVKEEEMYKGIDSERVKLLKEQKKRSKWATFLKTDELITEMGLVYKKKGLFPRKRQLLLTDEPRFIYLDPKKGIKKGEIPWDETLKCVVLNKKKFIIVTPKRTYYLEDLSKNPQKWKLAVGNIQKQYKLKKFERMKKEQEEKKNQNDEINENEIENDEKEIKIENGNENENQNENEKENLNQNENQSENQNVNENQNKNENQFENQNQNQNLNQNLNQNQNL